MYLGYSRNIENAQKPLHRQYVRIVLVMNGGLLTMFLSHHSAAQ